MDLLQPDKRAPNLDSLSVLDAKGSRRYVYPADARGRWSRIKPWVYLALIVIYVALPFVQIGGHPAVHVDFSARRFFLFGATFNAQDFYLAFFIFTGIGFGLIVVAALWGRVWCGWACPQTVFLDGVFRRLERWIEGPAARRARLAAGPWTMEKILKKGIKHTIYIALSIAIAHVFLAYFTSVDQLGEMITEGPGAHPVTFGWAVGLTAVIYGNFWWFREQLCIVICPYGRLQSVLQDKDTINVGYDTRRGEPRGKAKDPTAGDCVDCGRCVAVCPTGIDIRNGHQLECIGCAYCIDACDEIMVKLDRPKGLIRYDSEAGFEGEPRRFWRGRVFAYIFAGLVGLVVAGVFMSGNDAFEANLLRVQGAPYTLSDDAVENRVRVHVVNKRPGEATFTIRAAEGAEGMVFLPQASVTLDTFVGHDLPVVIKVPLERYKAGMQVVLEVTDSVSGEVDRVEVDILGPHRPVRKRAAEPEEPSASP